VAERTCEIEGCSKPHKSRGMCPMHYARWRKSGDPNLIPERPSKRPCSIDGCDRVAIARSWCVKHYQRWQAHGDPNISTRRTPGPCVVADCTTEGNGGHGLCEKHYRRFQRHGSPLVTSRIVGDHVARFESYLTEGVAPEHAAHMGACWLWIGLLTRDGYGVMASDLPTPSAHRWSYRHHVADIPEGLELDHLCRVRNCVNPWHLDPVPQDVNKKRAAAAKRSADLAA